MAVIDMANALYMRPKAGDEAQTASNVLDFGAGDNGGQGNYAGYLNFVSTKAGSASLEDSDDNSSWAAVANSTITLSGAGAASIVLPKHRRYVRGKLTTVTTVDCDLYIGAAVEPEVPAASDEGGE